MKLSKQKAKKTKPLIILLFGKSGSGKGTQADLLVKKFKLAYVGSGDLLRARKAQKDFTGRKIIQVLKKGGLISTPVIFSLWIKVVEKLKNKKNLPGFIIDGSPRKLFEAYLIDELLQWYEWEKNLKLILIDVSDQVARQRLVTRGQCKKCKEIISLIGQGIKQKRCPKCGGQIQKRPDDQASSVKNRLQWFKTDVQPIIDYYRQTGRLIKINGEQSVAAVFKDVLKALGEK